MISDYSDCNTWLMHGDCLARMKELPDNSIDMVLCDLPYGTTACKWDTIIPFDHLWAEYTRVCNKGAAIILMAGQPFTTKLISSNMTDFKYTLVWQKSKCGSPLLAKYRPMIKHEDVVVFSLGGGKHTTYNPQLIAGSAYSRTAYERTGENNHKFGITKINVDNVGTRHPSSVLDFPMKWRRQDQIHPTQKPVELMEWLVRSFSNEGDIVLDNCFGSGTTGIACRNTNRNFVGIEQNDQYFDIGKKRINLK